jgi:indoleamine 2,3-dioxygenase
MTVPEKPPTSTLQLFPYVKDDPVTIPHSIDPFTITTSTGFLPYQLSPTTLPGSFESLTNLLDRLPVKKLDGTPGLLDTYELGAAVKTDLPDLTSEVNKLLTKDGKPDLFTITAVFRDYAFLASAYLLEPCWENWRKDPDGGYGLGRDFLPRAIAGPMVRCADMYVPYDTPSPRLECTNV